MTPQVKALEYTVYMYIKNTLIRYARLAAAQPAITDPLSTLGLDDYCTRPHLYSATKVAEEFLDASDKDSFRTAPLQTITAECDGTPADHENPKRNSIAEPRLAYQTSLSLVRSESRTGEVFR